jgi:hypothetical protein
VIRTTEWLRFQPRANPDSVSFETGYDSAARESHRVFRRLRDAGAIPAGTRFQVCLPTPMASGYMYVSPSARPAYLRTYERSLRAALELILASIRHTDLAIQWDVRQEVLVFENYFVDRPATYRDDVFGELGQLGNAATRASVVAPEKSGASDGINS